MARSMSMSPRIVEVAAAIADAYGGSIGRNCSLLGQEARWLIQSHLVAALFDISRRWPGAWQEAGRRENGVLGPSSFKLWFKPPGTPKLA